MRTSSKPGPVDTVSWKTNPALRHGERKTNRQNTASFLIPNLILFQRIFSLLWTPYCKIYLASG